MEQGIAAVDVTQSTCEKGALVDPFLVEALQNSRHRLTILWMERDIQKFLQNTEQQQFEFQHFPTSYLRLAAHRVAQHYGLATMVLENAIDGMMNKILVRKTEESRYPLVCLSEIPSKESESDQSDNVKIAIRQRPSRRSISDLKGSNTENNPVKSMEERKEEYDKARARIFRMNMNDSDEIGLLGCPEETEIHGVRNGNSSRVAILRDKEKDLTDPDYDRSYERYVKSKAYVQVPFVQYPVSYQAPAGQVMNTFNAMNWPSSSVMYAHSYEQLRHSVFQAPFCQQNHLI